MTERLILTTKQLFFSLTLASTCYSQWEPIPPLPEPNGGFACSVTDDKIVIVGGTNWVDGKKHWLKAIHAFDPGKNAWSKVGESERAMAYGVNYQCSNVKSGFVGGSDGSAPRQLVCTFEGLKLHTEVWATLPKSIVLACGGCVGQQIIIVGGTDDAANIAGLTRSTYLIENGNVKLAAEFPGMPLAVAATSVSRDELFIFGGMNYDAMAQTPVNSANAYAFSPSKNTWRQLSSLQLAKRGLTAVELDEGQIYIAGGYADDFTADAVIYDVKTDSYRKAPSLPYAAMVALVRDDGFVYCLGGEDKKQSRTDKAFRIRVTELLK